MNRLRSEDLTIPTFDEIVSRASAHQASVTNLVHIDVAAGVVFKAFLSTTNGVMMRSGIPRSDARGEEAHAINEAEQLVLLKRILHDVKDVYSPQVLGRNGAVLAIEYLNGIEMSALTAQGNLTKDDFVKIARVLATIHQRLATEAPYIREHFPIPKKHTANPIVCFEEKTSRLREQDWKETPQLIARRFSALVEKARAVSVQSSYHIFPDAIFGDAKDDNMITVPDGRIAVFDPALCAGRLSMDIAKFARSILLKNPTAYRAHFQNFLSAYYEHMGGSPDEGEIAHMLGIDMLNIIRGYLQTPESLLSAFPPVVRNVQEHIDEDFLFIERALEGDLGLQARPQ